jgi:hypothetical protein
MVTYDLYGRRRISLKSGGRFLEKVVIFNKFANFKIILAFLRCVWYNNSVVPFENLQFEEKKFQKARCDNKKSKK